MRFISIFFSRDRAGGERLCRCVIFLLAALPAIGQQSPMGTASTNNVYPIDLVTVLELAHARNLDIQIAKEKLFEAQANKETAVWQFFPWLSPGVAYRRHDNLIQDVGGSIIDVHKESYSVGPTITGEIQLGPAIYTNLISRQLVKAADFGLESQRQEATLAATAGYFDLLKAHAGVSIAREGVKILTNYLDQVQRAVEAGIAFEGDFLRVQVQSERSRMTLRQAEEQERIASARLAEILRLEPKTQLTPNEIELAPQSLVATNASLDSLVSKALSTRPELSQSQAAIKAARYANKGAVYGPMIPSLGAQAFAGGMGGGKEGSPYVFGESEDYQVTLSWRLGPGGLFDRGRVRASEARLRIADASALKVVNSVTREVVETHTRVESLLDQLKHARRAVQAAEKTLQLSEDRKQFAVGNVLETILAEEDLTRARLDLSNASADYNKAQYALQRAIGGFAPSEGKPRTPK